MRKSITFAPHLKNDLVAQLVEHIPFKDGVLGSSPSWITSFQHVFDDDLVAQLVEHIPFKDGVLGSSPSWITKQNAFQILYLKGVLFYFRIAVEIKKKFVQMNVQTFLWALRDSNPRPSACKADALNQLS
jgi:hypothetical protein